MTQIIKKDMERMEKAIKERMEKAMSEAIEFKEKMVEKVEAAK